MLSWLSCFSSKIKKQAEDSGFNSRSEGEVREDFSSVKQKGNL